MNILKTTGMTAVTTAATGATIPIFPIESPLYKARRPKQPHIPAMLPHNLLDVSGISSPSRKAAAIRSTVLRSGR